MKFPIYEPRIIISLLGGKWKTAPEIAREWHTKGTTPDTVYRTQCKLLTKTLLKYHTRKFKDKRRDTEYTLELINTSNFLAKIWKIEQSYVLQLLKNPSFQRYTNDIEKPSWSKRAIMLLGILYLQYSSDVLIKHSYSEKDKELIYKINEKK